MQRAAKSAEDLVIKTNTANIVAVDGTLVLITAAELIKMRGIDFAKPSASIQSR